MSLDDARRAVRSRMERREQSFLRLVKQGIFEYPASPYLPLMRHVGCQPGDVESLVRNEGIEGALLALRKAGIYFSFEEFKRGETVSRGSLRFDVLPDSFDNPYLSHYYFTSSGGTTSAGTRVSTDLDHLRLQASHVMITQHAHGVLDAPRVLWRPILPSGSGINNVLHQAHVGRYFDRWFTPCTADDLVPALRFRLANAGTIVLARLCGAHVPTPEPVRLDDGRVIARWAVETITRHGQCLVMAPVSAALRVCVAAADEGTALDGATFMVAGEPASPAKITGIRRTGARCFTTYGLAESGRVGMGCASADDASDVHLLSDAFAVIPYPREVHKGGPVVEAFNLTSIAPTTPKIMLNVEVDDYGAIERRPCDCVWNGFGFTTHLRGIRSFRKLTGEGVTLVASEMTEILESVLPERFGGSALDYQLLEEEDEQGFTRLTLIVSPDVDLAQPDDAVRAVQQALSHSSAAADMAQEIWRQAGSFRVRRSRPVWTERGKMLSIRVEREQEAGGERNGA
ncbi:MAG: hypothetical protein PVJ49_00915 [Acidobacteriota bacterium]